MRNKPSYARWTRPATSLLAVFLVVLAAAPAFMPLAAAPPPWLRQLAREPLPAYPADTDAVMLLDEGITTVRPDGETVTLVRQAYKILRPQGRSYARVGVFFDGETRINSMKAWTISASGREYELKEKDAVERSLGSGVFQDTRIKELFLPEAEPGSVVGWEYEQRTRPHLLENSWWLELSVPVRRSRFTIRLPEDWEYSVQWANFTPVEPQRTGANDWTWDMQDIPPLKPEPAMPAVRSLAGRLVVTYFTSRPGITRQSKRTWGEIGEWYRDLTEGRRASSPEIKQKVAELTAGKSGLLEKVRDLAAFAQEDVRYVSIQIGIGGYQPHFAREIFANRYGDCKDKATILSAMLAEIGVPSEYVLIHSDRGVVQESLPSPWSFNHVILAIQLPEDAASPDLVALGEAPGLGRVLFFDPTDTYTRFGLLPASLQANHGLLVGAQGGELLRLPLLDADHNRLLRTGHLRLAPDGAIAGEVREVRSGRNALWRRAQLRETSLADRPKLIERSLAFDLPTFVLQSSEFANMEKSDTELQVDFRFSAPAYAKRAGNLLLVRPRVLGSKSRDFLEATDERKFPVEFESLSRENDTFEISLPDGYEVDEIPDGVELDYGFARYHSRYEVEGRVLRYHREYVLREVLVPTERLQELKRFYRQIAADERASAVLRRKH